MSGIADGAPDTASIRSVPPGYPADLERDAKTGGLVLHVRPITPDDAPRLAAFHGGLSPYSIYLRFFSFHPVLSDQEVRRFTQVDYHDRLALVAVDGDRLVAVARYDRHRDSSDAEVAFVVDDQFQRHGIATLLLDELARAGWERGITSFSAETLLDNKGMVNVFFHSGFPVTYSHQGGVVSVRFPIEPVPAYREALAVRERSRTVPARGLAC